jgi:hypothetical protein
MDGIILHMVYVFVFVALIVVTIIVRRGKK